MPKLEIKIRFLIVAAVVLFGACSKITPFNQKGWTISIDSKNERILIKHKNLGVVLKDITLNVKRNGKLVNLSDWEINRDDNRKITIKTNNPEAATWIFIETNEGIDINSSVSNGIVRGIAPAPGGRIPARVASQDNGVIYTSLGFVSAENIYCLFDRETDTMIQFPEKSDLQRNASDKQLMDVVFPLLPSRDPIGEEGRTRRG